MDGLNHVLNDIRMMLSDLLASNKIVCLKLYGSYARGEARDGSDIDIYLVYDGMDRMHLRDILSEVSYSILIKHSQMVAFVSHSVQESQVRTRFRMNIERDGVDL